MKSTLKQLSNKNKYWLFGLGLLLVFVLFAVIHKPIRIIDKYNTLMRSSSQVYATRVLSSINQIMVHHAASIGQTAEDYARYHVSKGWPGIGYHFVIEVNGDIIGCNPLTNVSYGVSGHNTRSIHICLSGDFTKQVQT